MKFSCINVRELKQKIKVQLASVNKTEKKFFEKLS